MHANVLTLRMDAAAQARFERMRQAHYPAALNRIAAHLTLFHTLPDSGEVSRVLAELAWEQRCFDLRVTGLRSLGRGVAYTLASAELQAVHAALSATLAEHLSAQDRQRFQPHVVIQNKSTPESARELLTRLTSEFEPFSVQALGLDVWHYLGGPWQHAQFFAFAPTQ